VVFALLLITMEKPMVHNIRHQFKHYGDFDTVVKNDRSTFLNFQNYKDAKQALNGSKLGVPVGNLMVRPLPIQHTKMLMNFEQILLEKKDDYKHKDFMDIQFVKEFVSSYRARKDFDMKWEKDDNMVEECSKVVLDLYGWVYHKNGLFFSSGKSVEYAKECEDINNAINNSLKPSFMDAVKKSVAAVGSIVKDGVDIADVFVEADGKVAMEIVVEDDANVANVFVDSVVKVVVNNDFDIVICENKKDVHVQQKFVNELNRLEIDFFGAVNTKEIKINARLVELEECLCLSKDGFDVQERIFHISKSVKKLSKWLDCQETDVKF